jgi:acetyltransferase-like isoleucine patch superfamily enzyme
VTFYIIFLKSIFKKSFLSLNSSVTFFKGRLVIGKSVRIKSGFSSDLSHGELVIDDNVWINKFTEINPLNRISIGKGTTIQKNVTINGDVQIGCGCIVAPNVFISSGTHIYNEFPDLTIRQQEALVKSEGRWSNFNKPVSIADDVWLGINVVIMPGIRIVDGVVVGANSVVTKSLMEKGVYAGVPAKKVSERL